MGGEQESHEVDIKELEKVGKSLNNPPNSKDSLCKLLKQVLLLLSSINQSPHERILSAMQSSVEALVKPKLLKHKDKDVRLLVATCISDVMRIVAPEAPYNDEILKDVFELIVASFKGLNETSSPHFERRVSILEAVATYRSCIVMLDLECDHLIQEMFLSFFSTVSDEVSIRVMEYMKTIMCLVLMESEEIPEQLLELLLGHLLRGKKEVSKAACILARAVLKDCHEKLTPHVEAFLNSIILKGKSSKSGWLEDYSDLIYEIYTCAPSLLLPSLAKLTDELLTDELDVRLKAVELLGRMFASQQGVSDVFAGIFLEYLKRFTDKAVEVRLAMVGCAKQCLLAHPSGPRAGDTLSALSERLQDFDTGVRLGAVRAICDFAKSNPEIRLVNELKRVAERLRDREVTIRQETQQRLIDLYKSFCSKKVEGLSVHTEMFFWIPSKLIRSSCDKDSKEFRAQGIELVSEQLFPLGFPVKDTVMCWIESFVAFDEYDRKAFHYILHQKQRLHSEMRSILSLRQKYKDEESQEVEARVLASCKSMSNIFADSSNAETQLQKLIQLKDSKLFKDLTALLDPDTPIAQSISIRTNLLNRLGEKHPLYEFVKVLSMKCSYTLFGKEHMRILLTELRELGRLDSESLCKASMGLLVDFTNYFPTMLDGMEEDVMVLLNEGNDFLKDGALQVLAKVGGTMRGRIVEGSKSVDLLGELCVDGSRKQAKYAVQALASMSNDSGLKAFSGLYRKLLDLLESCIKLPTILQSLGCIAQHAMSVFEAHEEDLVNFLVRDLFRRDSVPRDCEDHEECPVGEITALKIFGLKTLVRSFLPIKDSQQTQRLKGLLGILLKFVESGEIADDIKSSGTDKAHLRLAAAKGVLRLSKRYDVQISPQLFRASISCAKDSFTFVRRQFLSKLQKFLKERQIPLRYACAFAVSIGLTNDDVLQEAKQQLRDFVESSRRQARQKDPFGVGQSVTPALTCYPEHVLFHFVHLLAHQADFSRLREGSLSSDEVKLHLKQLYLFLWALLNHDTVSTAELGDRHEVPYNVSLVYGIFCAMKDAKDIVDASKTESTYILCDIGITILKKFFGVDHFSSDDIPSIPLPESIYKSSDHTGESKKKIDGSYLPDFFEDDDGFSQLLPFNMHVRKVDQVESAILEEEDKPVKKQGNVVESSRKKRKAVQNQTVVTNSTDPEIQQEVKLTSEPPADDERTQVMEQRKSYQEKSPDMEMVASPETLYVSRKRKRNLLKEDEPILKQKRVTGAVGKKKKASEKGNVVMNLSGSNDQQAIKLSAELPGGKEDMGQTSSQEEFAVNVESMAAPKKMDVTIKSPKQKRKLPKEDESLLPKEDESLLPEEDEDETLLSAMQKQKRLKSKVEEDEVVKDEAISSSPKMIGKNEEAAGLEAMGSATKHVRISIKDPKPPQEPVNADAGRHHGEKVPENIDDQVQDVVIAEAQKIQKSGASPKKSVKSISLESPKLEEIYGKELLNKRVLVYWPLDKRFYQGTIRAYNAKTKLHEVVYDDGDKERLNLQMERWKLVEEDELAAVASSPATPRTAKPASQLIVKEGSLEKKKQSKQTSSSSRSYKKVKPDASSMALKPFEESSYPSDAVEDSEILDRDHELGDAKEASRPADPKPQPMAATKSKKKAASVGSQGSQGSSLKVNNQTEKGTPPFSDLPDSEDDVPLIAWKPVRKKGE